MLFIESPCCSAQHLAVFGICSDGTIPWLEANIGSVFVTPRLSEKNLESSGVNVAGDNTASWKGWKEKEAVDVECPGPGLVCNRSELK
jgi:hypothetical protein